MNIFLLTSLAKGYGFTLANNKLTKLPEIGKVDPGSPAAAAGLKPKDIIIEQGLPPHPGPTRGGRGTGEDTKVEAKLKTRAEKQPGERGQSVVRSFDQRDPADRSTAFGSRRDQASQLH